MSHVCSIRPCTWEAGRLAWVPAVRESAGMPCALVDLIMEITSQLVRRCKALFVTLCSQRNVSTDRTFTACCGKIHPGFIRCCMKAVLTERKHLKGLKIYSLSKFLFFFWFIKIAILLSHFLAHISCWDLERIPHCTVPHLPYITTCIYTLNPLESTPF